MVTFRAQTFILVCVSAAACGRRGDDRADHEAQRGDSLAIVGVTVIDVAARDAAGAIRALEQPTQPAPKPTDAPGGKGYTADQMRDMNRLFQQNTQ